MTRQTLTTKERKALERLVTRTKDAQQLRRVQALLWLDQGDTVQEVADRLRLSRQVIYKWVAQFHSRARSQGSAPWQTQVIALGVPLLEHFPLDPVSYLQYKTSINLTL